MGSRYTGRLGILMEYAGRLNRSDPNTLLADVEAYTNYGDRLAGVFMVRDKLSLELAYGRAWEAQVTYHALTRRVIVEEYTHNPSKNGTNGNRKITSRAKRGGLGDMDTHKRNGDAETTQGEEWNIHITEK